MIHAEAKNYLHSFIQEEKIPIYQRFFKTAKGEYGYGDKFLGITVPDARKAVKQYSHLTLQQLEPFITSEYHEERLFALLVLVAKYQNKNASDIQKYMFYRWYIHAMEEHINSWDLVDTSAPQIIGHFLYEIESDSSVLRKWATSENLWIRRIAIIATLYAIKKRNYFADTLAIATILLQDKHDLIHRATGWMLREVGKKDKEVLIGYLDIHTPHMPRTMLRYAIEKFDQPLRLHYLQKEKR